jgi:hypothetical protein
LGQTGTALNILMPDLNLFLFFGMEATIQRIERNIAVMQRAMLHANKKQENDFKTELQTLHR